MAKKTTRQRSKPAAAKKRITKKATKAPTTKKHASKARSSKGRSVSRTPASTTTATRPTPGSRPRSNPVLTRLDKLAHNLWWTWDHRARRLFEGVDPTLWNAANHNPIRVLQLLSPTRAQALKDDQTFIEELEAVEAQLDRYLNAKTWYARSIAPRQKDTLSVAYFCMEYGLHESLPLYSGGLGILAADHLKSASDLGVPLCAIGILWRKGYYQQEITNDGRVKVHYPPYDFSQLPVTDTRKSFTIDIGNRTVTVKVWKLLIGRVPLYLLDTDLPSNHKDDRALTSSLYGVGKPDYRLRQEILLGVGGVRALETLRIKPSVIHLNEGHAAFAGLELLRKRIRKRQSYDEALRQVRAQTVFTTHTPVPAGHDRFPPNLINRFLKPIADQIGLTRKQLLALGRVEPDDNNESFCMTVLALKLAERANGVAELHGHVSRQMWKDLFNIDDPDPTPQQVPIDHVTNGVHPPSWIAEQAIPFYNQHLKPNWINPDPDDDWWANAAEVSDDALWNLRLRLKRNLITRVRQLMRDQLVMHQASEEDLAALTDTFHEDALTIGFARRFATYKRATLIFRDPERLDRIVNHPERPVQFIFAGKAHPADAEGNEFVTAVHEMTQDPRFRGRIYLLQNYDKSIGELLTSGTDVWLNNPIRPMEASGTSGMKPPLNGGINCSILDGWWPEGYNGKNGWALGDGSQLPDREAQDDRDANAIYTTLESEVVPAFYKRDKHGIPRQWTARQRESMRSCGAAFSTHRMVADYTKQFYLPANG